MRFVVQAVLCRLKAELGAIKSVILVPKLRLGTQLQAKLRFTWQTESAGQVCSQTESGNKDTY
ncbi:hypothetical protein QUF80_23085 [Desulfococcaceae bacterium HSG8]|nr:hypothetical protein [Desulfococcaceae bacterium HSG8]